MNPSAPHLWPLSSACCGAYYLSITQVTSLLYIAPHTNIVPAFPTARARRRSSPNVPEPMTITADRCERCGVSNNYELYCYTLLYLTPPLSPPSCHTLYTLPSFFHDGRCRWHHVQSMKLEETRKTLHLLLTSFEWRTSLPSRLGSWVELRAFLLSRSERDERMLSFKSSLRITLKF